MNGVTFNQGMLFVESPDGELHPIGEVGEIELDEAVSAKDRSPTFT